MTPPAPPPPDHVLTAFGVASSTPEPLADAARKPSGRTWRCDGIVLKHASTPAEASWLAAVLDQVRVSGVRLARPVRSSDGRWVVSGWAANRFVSGSAAVRPEEIMRTSTTVHDALAGVERPRFLRDRTDLIGWADRMCWGEVEHDEGRAGTGHGARLLAELATARRPVTAAPQMVHADLSRNVLFADEAPPAVVDFLPFWRPAAWAAAVVAVDAYTRQEASIELLANWGESPDWPQIVLRAVMFRLAVALSDPRTEPDALVGLLAAAEQVQPILV